MSTPIEGRDPIEGPAPLIPYGHGLFSVAQEILEAAGRWQISGVEYDSDNCAVGSSIDGLCPDITPTPPVCVTGSATATPSAVTPAPLVATLSYSTVSEGGTPEKFTLKVTSAGASKHTVTCKAGAAAAVTVAPGETKDLATGLEAGDVAVALSSAAGTVTPTSQSITVPLAAPVDHDVNAQPPSTNKVVLTAPAGNPWPVTVTSTPAGITDTLIAGGTATFDDVAANTYQLTISSPAGDVTTASLVVPGTTAVTVSVEVCTPAPPDPSKSSHYKGAGHGLDVVEGSGPFTVYHHFACSPVGIDDSEELAKRRLALVEERQVERWFSWHWLGDRHDQADKPAGTDPVNLKHALGALEAHAAITYGGLPTFHMPRWVGPYLVEKNLAVEDNGVLRTALFGSPINLGGGNFDDPPNVAAPVVVPGTFWIYITGSVRIQRAPAFANTAFEIKTNSLMTVAERTYAVDSDCLLAAALGDVREDPTP